jgi:hypothetical protein
MVICRGELLVVVPIVTCAVGGLGLGLLAHKHHRPGTHAADSGLVGYVLGGFSGAIIGVVIDVVLLYKWLIK